MAWAVALVGWLYIIYIYIYIYIDQFLPGLEAGEYQNRVVDGSEAGKYGCGNDTNTGISNPGGYTEGPSLKEES